MKASEQARQSMRWPIVATSSLVLLVLTAIIALLLTVRPAAAGGALLICSILLAARTFRPRGSYDTAIGWVYRLGAVGGAAGELLSHTVLRDPQQTVHGWQWLTAEAIGIGGGIGLGMALATSTALVVVVFLYSTSTFPARKVHRSTPAQPQVISHAS